jgi:hypothetical protein
MDRLNRLKQHFWKIFDYIDFDCNDVIKLRELKRAISLLSLKSRRGGTTEDELYKELGWTTKQRVSTMTTGGYGEN